MAASEIQPFPGPPAMQPRRQLSRAEAVSFKELKSFMAEAFREVDAENTHVPEGLCARTDQPEPSRTSEHSSVGGSPTSTRSFQLPRSASTSYNRTLGRQAGERLRRELMEVQASPVLPLTPRMEARLERQCERGVEFLQRLQLPAYARTKSLGPAMPKTALSRATGLTFMWTHKVGLVSGFTWGTGFVIARLSPGVWSAPCFLRDRFFSLGATAGAISTATCYAIPTKTGLEQFKSDEMGTSLDIALTLGMDPFEGDTPVRVKVVAERVGKSDRPQDRVKSYRTSDGIILDASCRFGVHAIDWKTNQVVYGDGITPTDILDGKVQVPAQFRPLYNTIERMSLEGTETKPVLSQFELEKARVRAASLSRQSSLLRRVRRISSTGITGLVEAGFTRRSMEEPGDNLPSASSSSSVPSVPDDVPSPNASFRLFCDFAPLDIDLDSDEPLATITEHHVAEKAAASVDAAV